MTETPTRNYHTIGEVLNILKAEFPDVSISKLRFLESQGLISPARTRAGYRKFDSRDIDRLRFILREQRDRFLPLRVIKNRLESWERGELEPVKSPSGPAAAAVEVEEHVEVELAPSGVRLDHEELAASSGLDLEHIEALERYGLIAPFGTDDELVFDECALVVAKIARGFGKYGIEARHLRMFAHTADREAALFEQVVAPMLAHHTPQARREAIHALGDLATLARKLHQALLAQKLRDHSGSK